MSEQQREGWALTSNGRNYRKVTGVRVADSWDPEGYLTSVQVRWIKPSRFFVEEQAALEAARKNAQEATEKARKSLANAERDEARLIKRAKELKRA